MPASRRDALWLAALLGLLVGVGLLRPLLPIDETRYASVAWEMWTRGDFLVPYRNGEPYRPPMAYAFYNNINDADISAIIAYLRSLKPQAMAATK